MSATPNGAAAQPFVAHSIRLTLNGQDRQLDVLPWTTLLDLLREQLDLVGSKKGCDHGQCGACTVLRDGKRVNACLTLAVMCDGAELTTIEGLAEGDQLHPHAASLYQARCLPVRLLHPRPDLFRRGPGQ
ncbi:aerobic-type carbon monoxide dehydrogenase small subunit (CoxS/CutS family) [Pseudomonas synxantha]|nr:aerobic-type carbon monoxide dehydrogenase small subunit (CoxS/CutS family) [Pseudomonas synxantha]